VPPLKKDRDACISSSASHPSPAAFIAFVGETSLSDDLKRRLTRIAADCSRWDEMQEKVDSIVSYFIDLWDCGGESSYELLRVAGRVRELS